MLLLLALMVSLSPHPSLSRTVAASSFPGRLPASAGRQQRPHNNANNNHYNNNADWYLDTSGSGGGGASSDDEASEDEDESSDDEEWNRLSASLPINNNNNNKAHQQQQRQNYTTATTQSSSSSSSATPPTTTASTSSSEKQQSVASTEKAGGTASPATKPDTTQAPPKPTTTTKANTRSTTPTTTAAAAGDSQPMQTLSKLQQMLDDTDYMTSNSNRKNPSTESSDKDSGGGSSGGLWTSKDRSKYKRMQNRNEQKAATAAAAQLVQPLFKQQEQEQQQTQQRPQQPHQQQQQRFVQNHRPSPPIQFSSDDENSEEDIDDGLGYTLPNLPVYYSDGEESEISDEDGMNNNNNKMGGGGGNPYGTPPPPTGQYGAPPTGAFHGYHPLPPHQQQHQQQHHPPPPHYNNNGMQQHPHAMPQSPYGTYNPQHHAPPHQQQQQQQQQHNNNMYGYQYPYPPSYMTPQQHAYYNSHYGNHAWSGQQGAVPHPQQQHQQHQSPARPMQPIPNKPAPQMANSNKAQGKTAARSSAQAKNKLNGKALDRSNQQSSAAMASGASKTTSSSSSSTGSSAAAATTTQQQQAMANAPAVVAPPPPFDYAAPMTIFVPPENLVQDATEIQQRYNLNFDSFQKIALALVTVTLACYSGVSPRTLPLSQYNLRFYENLGLVSLATMAPIVWCLLVIKPSENDVNAFINTFFTSFTLGYVWAFGAEIIATTCVRLIVFSWLEPKLFTLLTPKVPIPVIPWVLRESGYRPKRITLLAAEIAASCVVCPIIEEYVKLQIMQWTTKMKRNFVWTKKKANSSNNSKKTIVKTVAEPIVRPPYEPDIVNANQFVCQMLAASLGLKLCDAGRRILLYTKRSNPNKGFYAFCRGLFPIQELCGTMTALGLAKRNLLGVKMPLWKLLLPAVIFHGMANFRGKKPVYRWGSATPWSEMQLPAFHILDSLTLPQLLSKGFAKLMWLIIIFRVTGYCIKNYYMVNRQAVKRTTTYAGKPAAFSAELTTTEMLKKK